MKNFLKQKAIKKSYKEWSKIYDDECDMNLPIINESKTITKIINPKKSDIILDAGCGTGRYIKKLKNRVNKIIGIDFSKEMLKIAKEKNPNVEFHQHDLRKKLPFKNGHFNKIISCLVFSHLDEIEPTLKEFHRILKRNGKIIITDFVLYPTLNWNEVEYKRKRNYVLDFYKTSKPRPISEYVDKVDKTGFDIIKIIPLRTKPHARKYLTQKSYNKIKDKWGTVLYILEKK